MPATCQQSGRGRPGRDSTQSPAGHYFGRGKIDHQYFFKIKKIDLYLKCNLDTNSCSFCEKFHHSDFHEVERSSTVVTTVERSSERTYLKSANPSLCQGPGAVRGKQVIRRREAKEAKNPGDMLAGRRTKSPSTTCSRRRYARAHTRQTTLAQHLKQSDLLSKVGQVAHSNC